MISSDQVQISFPMPPTHLQFLIDQFGLANTAWFIRLMKRGTSPEQLAGYCVPDPRDSRRDGVFRALQYAASVPESALPENIRTAMRP
jgi:hypothetical protein